MIPVSFLLSLCYTVCRKAVIVITGKTVRFVLGGLLFEYDSEKNRKNIDKHGISFETAAKVFFDYDRIEFFDEDHSGDEDRYNTIGIISVPSQATIGNINTIGSDDVLFVVYTERAMIDKTDKFREVTRLISARMATSFERGVYYGKYN